MRELGLKGRWQEALQLLEGLSLGSSSWMLFGWERQQELRGIAGSVCWLLRLRAPRWRVAWNLSRGGCLEDHFLRQPVIASHQSPYQSVPGRIASHPWDWNRYTSH